MKFRTFLRNKGFVDTRGMKKLFVQADVDNSKALSKVEF
mgnify:CR=1 FL=1|jgi:hypothetical protein